jgi:hypothetical protein
MKDIDVNFERKTAQKVIYRNDDNSRVEYLAVYKMDSNNKLSNRDINKILREMTWHSGNDNAGGIWHYFYIYKRIDNKHISIRETVIWDI